MNFQQAVQSGFSKYVNFRGRASRSEFWWFQLFLLLGGVVAALLDLFAAGDVVLAGDDYSRSCRHGAQAA
jgi:uncharacterized membrane protein YhaH (DUF805 family)